MRAYFCKWPELPEVLRPTLFLTLNQHRHLNLGVRMLAQESSSQKIKRQQNELFSQLKTKYMSTTVPRIEKIEVQYKGQNLADDATFLMNKRLSTPYHCAMHISQQLARDSVLAFVKKFDSAESEDGTVVEVHAQSIEDGFEGSGTSEIATITNRSSWHPWDMNRPLEFNCELKLLPFNASSVPAEEIRALNRSYWTSCSLLLGAVAEEAFSEDFCVKLVRLPQISEKCGAFCYDVEMSESLQSADGKMKWKPDETALISLTKLARSIISQNLIFERLEMHKDDAAEIFKYNQHYSRRIEEDVFTCSHKDHVPIYRFGKYIDICDGPLVPSTSTMYHFVVTAVHQLKRQATPSSLWRFQGLSLPKQLQVHHAVWAMLEHRARNLVKKDLPFMVMDSASHKFVEPLHKYKSIENSTKRYNVATGQWLPDGWESLNEESEVSGN